MKYVLDTSAILSGKDLPADYELYSTPTILDEISKGKMRMRLDYLMESGLRIVSPSQESVAKVRAVAEKSRDIARVSEADIEILSLAVELDALLLTDDYSMQNLAALLNVRYKGISQEGITRVIKWRIRCKGCGRYFEEMHKVCPVCGSKLQTTRK